MLVFKKMFRKCHLLLQSIILSSVWLTLSEVILSEPPRNVVVPRTKCTIPVSDDHYYLKSSCEGDVSQCQLKFNDLVAGDGTIVAIKCKPGMSLVAQDFAVCFDGKWYPKDHNCIRLSSTCGLSPPMYTTKSEDNTITAPWHAEILEYDDKNESNYSLCAGTLITPKIVLTAYSCVVTEGKALRKKDPKKLFVCLGRTSRCESNFDQVVKVQHITGGGRYAALLASGLTELDRISILKLASPAEITYNVMPACFDSSILNPQTGYSFSSGVVVGLSGQDVSKERSNFPKKMEVFPVSITDQGNDLSPIFTTELVDLRSFGSGFIVDVSGRNYIFGVHVADYYYNGAKEGSDFNKVYFNSIGRAIRQYLRENQ